jgi:hypothetical protein
MIWLSDKRDSHCFITKIVEIIVKHIVPVGLAPQLPGIGNSSRGDGGIIADIAVPDRTA